MGLTSSPSTLFSSKMFSNYFSVVSQPRSFLYNPHLNIKFLKANHKNFSQIAYVSDVFHSYQDYCKRKSSKYTGLSLVACGAKDSGSSQEDRRALETVLRLYKAIENRNLNEVSDIIGEECRCICNFVSVFQPFYGKKQVLDFFSSLMKYLGKHIEFVVQPAFLDGMGVGVSWRLEWKNTGVSIGKGFSFYMVHIYQGKMIIKNVEMLMEPLLHVEPLKLKMMGLIMNLVDKKDWKAMFKGKAKRIVYVLVTLFFMVAVLLFSIRLSLD